MLELLAPAGSVDKMKFAFTYGADACYMGVPDFSLRSRLNNFTLDSVKDCIKYAHDINKKVYVTFNIFAHNRHIERFYELKDQFTDFLNGEFKPDAVIVSDPGLMMAIKEVAPNMDIHISTQANTINYKAVEFWKKIGAVRVILGREASLDDIKMIKKMVPDIEIEYFVHGAMCMSYSGRCFLSKYFTGASANLGACSHPCRWEYCVKGERTIDQNGNDVTEKKTDVFGNEREIILIEDEHGSYFYNSHDLCLIEYMKDLIEAGIVSFKVEGRTKSIAYVSQVIKAYRSVINSVVEDGDFVNNSKYWRDELNKLVNRGYTTGFLFDEAKNDPSSVLNSHLPNDYKFVGEIVNFDEVGDHHYDLDSNLNFVLVHNKIKKGDVVDIIPVSGKNYELKIEKIIDPCDLNELEEMSAGYEKVVAVIFDKDVKLEKYTLMMKDFIKK